MEPRWRRESCYRSLILLSSPVDGSSEKRGAVKGGILLRATPAETSDTDRQTDLRARFPSTANLSFVQQQPFFFLFDCQHLLPPKERCQHLLPPKELILIFTASSACTATSTNREPLVSVPCHFASRSALARPSVRLALSPTCFSLHEHLSGSSLPLS